jgi:hypothetical protein
MIWQSRGVIPGLPQIFIFQPRYVNELFKTRKWQSKSCSLSNIDKNWKTHRNVLMTLSYQL